MFLLLSMITLFFIQSFCLVPVKGGTLCPKIILNVAFVKEKQDNDLQ